MKTEILTKQDFQPIELKITIETKRELEFLWALFSQSPYNTKGFINIFLMDGVKDFHFHDFKEQKRLIFETLNKQLVK